MQLTETELRRIITSLLLEQEPADVQPNIFPTPPEDYFPSANADESEEAYLARLIDKVDVTYVTDDEKYLREAYSYNPKISEEVIKYGLGTPNKIVAKANCRAVMIMAAKLSGTAMIMTSNEIELYGFGGTAKDADATFAALLDRKNGNKEDLFNFVFTDNLIDPKLLNAANYTDLAKAFVGKLDPATREAWTNTIESQSVKKLAVNAGSDGSQAITVLYNEFYNAMSPSAERSFLDAYKTAVTALDNRAMYLTRIMAAQFAQTNFQYEMFSGTSIPNFDPVIAKRIKDKVKDWSTDKTGDLALIQNKFEKKRKEAVVGVEALGSKIESLVQPTPEATREPAASPGDVRETHYRLSAAGKPLLTINQTRRLIRRLLEAAPSPRLEPPPRLDLPDMSSARRADVDIDDDPPTSPGKTTPPRAATADSPEAAAPGRPVAGLPGEVEPPAIPVTIGDTVTVDESRPYYLRNKEDRKFSIDEYFDEFEAENPAATGRQTLFPKEPLAKIIGDAGNVIPEPLSRDVSRPRADISGTGLETYTNLTPPIDDQKKAYSFKIPDGAPADDVEFYQTKNANISVVAESVVSQLGQPSVKLTDVVQTIINSDIGNTVKFNMVVDVFIASGFGNLIKNSDVNSLDEFLNIAKKVDNYPFDSLVVSNAGYPGLVFISYVKGEALPQRLATPDENFDKARGALDDLNLWGKATQARGDKRPNKIKRFALRTLVFTDIVERTPKEIPQKDADRLAELLDFARSGDTIAAITSGGSRRITTALDRKFLEFVKRNYTRITRDGLKLSGGQRRVAQMALGDDVNLPDVTYTAGKLQTMEDLTKDVATSRHRALLAEFNKEQTGAPRTDRNIEADNRVYATVIDYAIASWQRGLVKDLGEAVTIFPDLGGQELGWRSAATDPEAIITTSALDNLRDFELAQQAAADRASSRRRRWAKFIGMGLHEDLPAREVFLRKYAANRQRTIDTFNAMAASLATVRIQAIIWSLWALGGSIQAPGSNIGQIIAGTTGGALVGAVGGLALNALSVKLQKGAVDLKRLEGMSDEDLIAAKGKFDSAGPKETLVHIAVGVILASMALAVATDVNIPGITTSASQLFEAWAIQGAEYIQDAKELDSLVKKMAEGLAAVAKYELSLDHTVQSSIHEKMSQAFFALSEISITDTANVLTSKQKFLEKLT